MLCYVFGLYKAFMFCKGTVDEKAAYQSYLEFTGPQSLINLLYPVIYDVDGQRIRAGVQLI